MHIVNVHVFVCFVCVHVCNAEKYNFILILKIYYSKILGIMISFLLYEYTLDSTEVRYNGIDGKLMNGNIM